MDEKTDDSMGSLKDSLDQFIGPLQQQVHELQHWLQCRNLDVTDQNIEDLESIEQLVTNLEATVSEMDSKVTREEDTMIYMERMHQALNLQRDRINYLSKNCDHLQLPQLTNMQHLQPSQALKSIISNNNNNNSINSNDFANHFEVRKYNNNNSNNKTNKNGRSLSSYGIHSGASGNNEMMHETHSNSNSGSGQQITAMLDGQIRKKRRLNPSHSVSSVENGNGNGNGTNGMNSNSNCSNSNNMLQLDLVGKDEFENVPKYVRSRLTQERINNAIQDFNYELKKKYKIMSLNPNKLSSHQFELYDRYQKQESSETKGCYFLSEDDLKGSQYFTKDQTGKAVMSVLRHVKRVKMIGGKHTKYVVI